MPAASGDFFGGRSALIHYNALCYGIGSCGAVASTGCHELTGKAMKFSIKSVMLLTLFVAMALTIGLLARELHVRRLQYEALRQEIAEDPKRMFYAERFRAKA